VNIISPPNFEKGRKIENFEEVIGRDVIVGSNWLLDVGLFDCLQEIAGLSVEPCEGEIIILVVFEIKKTEVLSFQNFQLFYLGDLLFTMLKFSFIFF